MKKTEFSEEAWEEILKNHEKRLEAHKQEFLREYREAKEREEKNKRDFEIIDGVLKKYKGEDAIVVIPKGVKTIGGSAFSDCLSLEGVWIPDSVTTIKQKAFWYCKNLIGLWIPDSIKSIGKGAFAGCSNLEGVNITDIAAWCNIDFEIPSSNPLFNEKSRLYLNDELVENLVIPNTVTEIKESAFHGCVSLTSLVIPDSVTSIGDDAFNNCTSLKSVEIGDSVTRIGPYAFSFCDNLKKVFIPKSVYAIGKDAFHYCRELTIYAERGHKPKDWYSVLLGSTKGSWNPDKRPVRWGATKRVFDWI